jgi:hypothetical protein
VVLALEVSLRLLLSDLWTVTVHSRPQELEFRWSLFFRWGLSGAEVRDWLGRTG